MPQARKNPQQYVAIGPSQVKKRMFHDRLQFLLKVTQEVWDQTWKKFFEQSEMFFNFHTVENLCYILWKDNICLLI